MEIAATAPQPFYDARYRHGYQRDLLASGYDACVLAALRWALERPEVAEPRREAVLDFGCGQGRYMPELAARFPRARISGADISGVALELAAERYPDASYLAADGHRVPAADESFDLIVSIDVIEHVADAGATAAELARLLRPGGAAVLTTPCANRGSIAWFYNELFGGFEETPDGLGRFATDEPAHLRRLTSGEARRLLEGAGLEVLGTRWWGHALTALADGMPGVRSLPLPRRRGLAMLDWRLFRRIPNGAAMVLLARRPEIAG